MAYEQKPGTANCWGNRDKKSDKAPDFKGKIEVLGVQMEIAVWKRLTKNGDEYLYVSIQEPYTR